MTCAKCSKCMCLGPVSFGLALGITSGLAVLLWSSWVMYHGATPMVPMYAIEHFTWMDSVIHALWAVLKGFVFGFIFGLIYNFFISHRLCPCCYKSSRKCECGDMASKPQEGKE